MPTLTKKMTLSLSAAALALAGGTAFAAHHGGQHGPDADGDKIVTQAEHDAHGDKMFARFDANGDGTINAADREARRSERFAKMDANGDGEVTQAEMAAGNMSYVARDGDKARITLKDGRDIPASRSYIPALKHAGLLPR